LRARSGPRPTPEPPGGRSPVTGVGYRLDALSFPDATHGFAAAGNLQLVGAQADTVVVTGTGELWAWGPPGAIWHSTDIGAHWSVMTPALPVAR